MALQHSPSIITDGLVLYLDAANPRSYPGAGTTWTDLSGNGNNGTLVNGVGYNSDNGGSLVFDGSNDIVNLNENIDFDITEPWSFSLWISPNFTGQWRHILSKDNGTTNCSWMFHSSNIFSWYQSFHNSTAYIWYTSGMTLGNTIPTNQFSELTITCSPVDADRTYFIAYLNGSEKSTTTFTWSPINRTQTFNRIGGVSTRFFLGNLAATKIYNRALTPQEVQQNFNALRNRYGI